MKRGLLLLGGLFALLVIINLFFFVDTQATEETEQNGNRSSFNSKSFGTMAFYTLLEEGGLPITRLQSPYTNLKDRVDIGALVIIAPPSHRNPSLEEFVALSQWIQDGGTVVIIDREILITVEEVDVTTGFGEPLSGIRSLQPTPLTRGVRTVELSQFASHVKVESPEVVYHLGNDRAAVLADTTVSEGRLILLTDPFLVANNGISRADNAVLATNLFAGWSGGTIAFDEYHHGYGSAQGTGLMSYFRGTPVPWMMAQAGLVALLAVYTFGRRFGRPLPLRQERRTTNLEFVSGMANITRLAKATDLAMQNIYAEFRKRLCRYSGLPSRVGNPRLAAAVARRSRMDYKQLEDLLIQCDLVANGAPATESELLALVTRVREIEAALKL